MTYLLIWLLVCLLCSLLLCVLEEGIRKSDWKIKAACFTTLTLPPLALLYYFINYRRK